MSSINERLRQYRMRQNLTLAEVAEKTGIPISTYKAWENGRQILGEPYMLLAEIYQVSLQELFTGEKADVFQILEKLDDLNEEIHLIKTALLKLF